MARWEPDARGRLLHAALDLFAEQGYDATTAAQIAERAGLTKTTLFRQFADKREILFQGQAASVATADAAVRGAPPQAHPLEALRIGLDALAKDHVAEQREIGRRAEAITATSPELQERAAFKRSAISSALAAALAERVEDGVAGVLADIGTRAYYSGFAEWARADGGDLVALVRRHLDDLLRDLRPVLDG
ncbi:MAG: helix-turn-helix domain containing protein [Gordonia paraffinivorans]